MSWFLTICCLKLHVLLKTFNYIDSKRKSYLKTQFHKHNGIRSVFDTDIKIYRVCRRRSISIQNKNIHVQANWRALKADNFTNIFKHNSIAEVKIRDHVIDIIVCINVFGNKINCQNILHIYYFSFRRSLDEITVWGGGCLHW